MSEKEMRGREGIFWIGIGVIICILALGFDLGSFHEPGPGFVAFLAGLFVSGVGLIMILSITFSKPSLLKMPDAVHPFRTISWPRLIYTVGLLLGYILFLNTLGYILATFLLMWGMFYDQGRKNWVSSFLFSILTVLISYLIFEVWLRCQLPRGILPWW